MIVDVAESANPTSRIDTARRRKRDFRVRAYSLAISIRPRTSWASSSGDSPGVGGSDWIGGFTRREYRPGQRKAPGHEDRGLSAKESQDFETRANSSFGLLICPSEITSRRNSPPRIQSNRMRILRFHVGIALRWYARWKSHAGKPLIFRFSASATPLCRPRLATAPRFLW